MLKAFDTSVLVAALSASHGVHDVARSYLDDALHVVAAEKAGADELLTFNGRDFRRMSPEDPTWLVARGMR